MHYMITNGFSLLENSKFSLSQEHQ